MTQMIEATYDGMIFRPDSPLELAQGTRYRLIIESLPELPDTGDVWNLLADAAGSVEAPPDWASEHDHYLYGSPKQEAQP